MKRLNLDETWEQCLKMWRWIVRQLCPRNIIFLKRKWLRKNGFSNTNTDCFFCDYAADVDDNVDCNRCPGYKIDKDFSCMNKKYEYDVKPAAFLRKLNELNKKRLAKRRKR